MKYITSNKYQNTLNFAIWYEAIGISMEDIEDYPSLTHYDIILQKNVSYTFITNNNNDDNTDNYIRFELR